VDVDWDEAAITVASSAIHQRLQDAARDPMW